MWHHGYKGPPPGENIWFIPTNSISARSKRNGSASYVVLSFQGVQPRNSRRPSFAHATNNSNLTAYSFQQRQDQGRVPAC
jgi:hypothetical protein